MSWLDFLRRFVNLIVFSVIITVWIYVGLSYSLLTTSNTRFTLMIYALGMCYLQIVNTCYWLFDINLVTMKWGSKK